MDLWAYANIADLEDIMRKNNIEVPRLRGLRLMKAEEPIVMRKDDINHIAAFICNDLVTSIPFWSSSSYMHEYSSYTSWLEKYYIDDLWSDNPKIRWDRIHGWKRRKLKTAIHNKIREYEKQYDVFNKYVGRDDILYIHARIGGGNWPFYKDVVINQPWFLEKIDDAYDSTYCDIYAKIDA